jgi:exopolysaccharide biosynthesis protein
MKDNKTKKINKLMNKLLILMLCFSITYVFPTETFNLHAQKKTTAKKSTKKKSTKKKPRRKSRKKAAKKAIPKNSHIFLKDTLLADGISYKHLHVTINGLKHSVNVLQVDLFNKKTEINVVKGGNNITELERLPEMLSHLNNNTSEKKVIGGINANFWRAYTNYPIGPTIIGGEIAEIDSYKKWTSTFFNDEGIPFTNFFNIQGEILSKTGNRIKISAVNRRSNPDGLVLYNKFGGDTIPYINSKKVEELMLSGLDNIFQEGMIEDSTENIENLAAQQNDLIEAQRASDLEFEMKKIILKYLEEPAVNTFFNCEIIGIDSGAVKIPENGCVLSLGKDIDFLPKIGEKVTIHFWTNVYESEIFVNSISGTPRLVRDGIARHEAYEEGSQKKRFINGALPRTAIGYNKDKSKLFLVAVDNKRIDGTTGASLAQLAEIMEYIGCYSAQNLDGGGSTNMVINGTNIINSPSSRRLSVGVSATSLKHEKPSPKLKKKK